MNKILKLSLIATIALLCSCNSSSSNSDVLFEGTLDQGAVAGHKAAKYLKHSAGEHIAEVQVCALGKCSTTDVEGEWGFVVGDDFNGGSVVFTINGHGIDTTITIDLPEVKENALINLTHSAGVVTATEILIDGEEYHQDEHEHDDSHTH